MSKWMGLTILAAGVAMILGCSQQPSGTAAIIEDKTYTVTPASVTVKAGIVTGEVTEMRVTERVEKGSDRVVSPAKLTEAGHRSHRVLPLPARKPRRHHHVPRRRPSRSWR